MSSLPSLDIACRRSRGLFRCETCVQCLSLISCLSRCLVTLDHLSESRPCSHGHLSFHSDSNCCIARVGWRSRRSKHDFCSHLGTDHCMCTLVYHGHRGYLRCGVRSRSLAGYLLYNPPVFQRWAVANLGSDDQISSKNKKTTITFSHQTKICVSLPPVSSITSGGDANA